MAVSAWRGRHGEKSLEIAVTGFVTCDLHHCFHAFILVAYLLSASYGFFLVQADDPRGRRFHFFDEEKKP